MPKQIFKLDNFSGGIANNPDSRDIQDNEFMQLVGWDISEQGILKLMGFPVLGLIGTPSETFFSGLNDHLLDSDKGNAGYGLFTFSSDNNGASTPIEFGGDRFNDQTSEQEFEYIGTDYLIHSGANSETFIVRRGDEEWYNSQFGFPCTYNGDNDYFARHIFQKHGKVLRVLDINTDNFPTAVTSSIVGDDGYPLHSPMWYGFVNHKEIFPPATGSFRFITTQIGWYATSSLILSGYQRKNLQLNGIAKYFTRTGGAWTDFETDQQEMGSTLGSNNFKPGLLVLTRHTSEGGWRGKKRYLYSYIYDYNQESQLTSFTNNDLAEEDAEKAFRLYFGAHNFGNITHLDDEPMSSYYNSAFNRRITGINVYFQNLEDVQYGDDRPVGEPIFMFHTDFKRGLKAMGDTEYGPWGVGDFNVYCPAYAGVQGVEQFAHFKNEPPGPTFDAMAGYSHDEESINCSYKTYCVANNRIWAGNISRYVTTGDTHEWVHEPDAMIKSLPLKHDIFPSANKIEVTIGDGDEIIALEAFGDKLLQFKKNKLHVVNIAQDFEFLEGTFEHRGVYSPHAVCLTDAGVFWVNQYGAFLFNGNKILNLLEKKGVQLINQTTWELFIKPWATADTEPYNVPSCTFLPHERQILIVSTLSDKTEDQLDDGIIIVPEDTIAYIPKTEEDDISETSLHTPHGLTGSGHRALLDPFWGKNSPANKNFANAEKRYTSYRRKGSNNRNMTSMGSFRMRNGVGPMMIFDLKSLSFVFDGDRLGTGYRDDFSLAVASDITKPLTVWGGQVVWSDVDNYYTWNSTPYKNNCFLRTKDFDFGAPGVKKKIYKVYITYKGTGNGMQVRYVTNGELESNNYRQFDSTTLEAVDRNSWNVAELKPAVSAQASNVNSFALIIHNDDASDPAPNNATFEINDISIVYRLKNVK
tara:strand:- start:800 stop:3559 length:2760 start_codon:yes stop_codon:yes gene_type:complete